MRFADAKNKFLVVVKQNLLKFHFEYFWRIFTFVNLRDRLEFCPEHFVAFRASLSRFDIEIFVILV